MIRLKHNKANSMKTLIRINKDIQIRTEYINEVSYTVAPVIMMVEGVHTGSGGSVFYSSAVLSNFHQAWNGVPVSIQHPEINGQPVSCNHPQFYETQVIGKIFNTTFVDGKLKAEIWIEEVAANRIQPEILTSLNNGDPIEVSTGLFTDDVITQGEWNGEQYDILAKAVTPDHLALLPGGTGACSWKDGCGVRANTDPQIKGGKVIDKSKMMAFLKAQMAANELSHGTVRNKLQTFMDTYDTEDVGYWVVEVYDDFFIFEKYNYEANTTTLYKQKYNKDSDDTVELRDNATEVVRKTTYETLEAAKANTVDEGETTEDVNINEEQGGAQEMSEKACCPEKVKAFIGNENNLYTDADQTWLEALTPEALEGMMKAHEAYKAPETVIETVPEVKEPMTFEEIMANADPAAREAITYGQTVLANKKADLTIQIKANKANPFSDDELADFDLPFLTKLAGMAPSLVTNYGPGGGGAPIVNDEGEVAPLANLETGGE